MKLTRLFDRLYFILKYIEFICILYDNYIVVYLYIYMKD